MSLQDIVNSASEITVDRRKQSASTVTRSGILRTTTMAGHVPWLFTITFNKSLKYSTNRDLIEEIDRLGVTEEETINIGNSNPSLAYITRYRGNASTASLSNITLNTFTPGGFIYANCSSVTGSTGFLFRAGDYIQPRGNTNGYRHPYTVTADITLSSAAGNSNVAIPVHRRVFEQPNVTIAGYGITWGANVTWPVKMLNKPKYSILPYDRVVFTEDFQLLEVMKDFYE
jgi:hypothetical protein